MSGTSGDGALLCCTQPAAWPAGTRNSGGGIHQYINYFVADNRRTARALTPNRYKDSRVASSYKFKVEGLLICSDWRHKPPLRTSYYRHSVPIQVVLFNVGKL